ncbi:MAG: recombinase family protein [Bdellovibrionales bacterium]|nr:recombinase family protein [Bdellovibrionales bacterium]
MRLNLDVYSKRVSKPLREGYAITRVSTSERARTQHGSLEQQWNRISRWEKNVSDETGLTYKVVHHIQEDTSGKRENTHRRLELLELSRKIETGVIDFIVVEKLDRLSRDEIFNLILAEKLVQFGVELFLIDGGKVDFRQSGDRWKFKIDNIRAGEYSEDLSQKVSIKQREAMVNNGKDPTPIPTLGLDKHKVWVGMYEVNEKELSVVVDIMKKFVDLKGSRKGTLKYCREKNYKTKAWLTESKVSSDGRRLPPKKMGGDHFKWDSLIRLLKNPKYRGVNQFYDYYGQFPDKRDKNGFVSWEYFHRREHGDIIDPKLLAQVDELVQTVEWKPRQNEFYLAGVVFAPDGSRYYGEAAKSGSNCYYYNRKAGHRIIAKELHDLVIQKLKSLIKDSKKFENLMRGARLQKQTGLSDFAAQRLQIVGRIEELNQIEERFSESIRALALKGADNLESAISLLVEEKETAKKEMSTLHAELADIELKEKSYKENCQGQALKKFLKTAFRDFDKMYDIEKKTLLQAVFPQILVHVTDQGVDLEIVISLDPFQSPSPAPDHRGHGGASAKILPFRSHKNSISNSDLGIKKGHFVSASPARGEEDTKWPFVVNGRTDWI